MKIALAAFIAGGLVALAGDRLSVPQLIAAGMLLLAVAPVTIGLGAIATGRIRLPIDRYRLYEESYSGVGARAWGLLFLLAGAALSVAGLLKLAGIEAWAGGLLGRWPGLAAAGVGLALVLFGVAQASKVSILRSGQAYRVCVLPERIGGAMTALLGLALMGGGLLHTASPALFGGLMSRLGRALLALAR